MRLEVLLLHLQEAGGRRQGQFINQENMATALQEAMVKIARLEAQASIQTAVPAPAGAAGAIPAVTTASAGGSDGVVTAQ